MKNDDTLRDIANDIRPISPDLAKQLDAITDKYYQRAIVLQLVNYLGLEFKDCPECLGTGGGQTWIPICQTCYGIGRVVFSPDKEESDG